MDSLPPSLPAWAQERGREEPDAGCRDTREGGGTEGGREGGGRGVISGLEEEFQLCEVIIATLPVSFQHM